jgi:hypothetical protein
MNTRCFQAFEILLDSRAPICILMNLNGHFHPVLHACTNGHVSMRAQTARMDSTHPHAAVPLMNCVELVAPGYALLRKEPLA